MKRLMIVTVTVALALACVTPARALVSAGAYADRLHLVTGGQRDGEPVEVNFFLGEGEVLLDTYGYGEGGSGGCVEISVPNEDGSRGYDIACGGPLEVEAVPVLALTTIAGTLDGSAYRYYNDPDNGPTFEYVGPSQIHIDLTFTGTGDPRLAHSERTGVGFCGLPPDTRGGFVAVEAPLERAAIVSGSLTGDYAGEVDPATLTAKMMDATYAETGACVDA